MTEITQVKLDEMLAEALHFITNIDNAHPVVRKLRDTREALASQALRSQGEAVGTLYFDAECEVTFQPNEDALERLGPFVGAQFNVYTHPAPQETGDVKVKPLEWIGDEAETPFGIYRLYQTDDGWGLSFNHDELVHVGFNSVASFESPREKAMSYAQPQYATAILSTITEGSSR
tara:strand:+ start:2535 stop:3059 length:525 start_codon:yes stop_codon:yes gene_type:complete